MARREVQEPVADTGRAHLRDGETRYLHPAFGQIRVARVSGGTPLYGSDFVHHNYVVIEISRSELCRNLSHDWPFARDSIVEVALSEAQWATFVSSMNVGNGVQCTIQREGYQMVPGLPDPIDTTAQFKAEAHEVLDNVLSELAELRAFIQSDQIKTSGKTREAMLARVDKATQHLNSNLPFVAKSFAEHVQRRADKAKIEVMAWIGATAQRLGLAAMAGTKPPIELPGHEPPAQLPSQENPHG